MKNIQEIQTKKFFEKNSANWSLKADFKKNKILNTIQARNLFALKIIKQYKLKYHLDVGCGSGYLTTCFAYLMKASEGFSYGIDHVKEMN